MSLITEYAEVLKQQIGRQGEAATIEVEKGAIRKFARAIGDPNPLYSDEAYAAGTRFGAIIAPPTFVSALKAPGLPPLPDPPIEFSVFLHTDDIIRSFAPIKVGDVITSAPELTDVFVKDGRAGEMLFTTFTYTMTNQHGQRVAILAWTEVQYGSVSPEAQSS
jgi:acyl dehydratase